MDNHPKQQSLFFFFLASETVKHREFFTKKTVNLDDIHLTWLESANLYANISIICIIVPNEGCCFLSPITSFGSALGRDHLLASVNWKNDYSKQKATGHFTVYPFLKQCNQYGLDKL